MTPRSYFCILLHLSELFSFATARCSASATQGAPWAASAHGACQSSCEETWSGETGAEVCLLQFLGSGRGRHAVALQSTRDAASGRHTHAHGMGKSQTAMQTHAHKAGTRQTGFNLAVEVLLTMSPGTLSLLQQYAQMAANSLRASFASHINAFPLYVSIAETFPPLGDFDSGSGSDALTLLSAGNTAQNSSDMHALLLVVFHVNVTGEASDNLAAALTEKMSQLKHSQAELGLLTTVTNTALASHMPQGSDAEVVVTSVSPKSLGWASEAGPLMSSAVAAPKVQPEPCCRENPSQSSASLGECYEPGVDVFARHESLLSLFGDNVAMNPRSYQFFLERACVRFHGALKCTYTEITDPNVYSHDFAVGKTNVKIQGFDMSGNSYECIKTLFVYDEQPPVFTTPADERATKLTHDVNATTCNVQNKDPFEEYENLGSFSATGSDNCDQHVEIVKQLFDQEGVTKLYDSREDDPHGLFTHGPGVYKLVYLAIDDYSANIDFPERRDNHETTHNVTLTLRDTTGPTQVSECPPDMNVTIGAHEIETEAGNVTWTVPEVTGDNCLHIIPPLAAEEVTGKEPGMRFPVGATRVEYIFKDGSGNAYEEECKFTVTVVQKENPVKITCPADVTVDTLEHAYFALVSWPAPVATQGGAPLDVVYPQGVAPGMPFNFGITDVKARAVGTLPVGQTGDLPVAECFFTVTVRDPEDPMCDQRMLRCDAGSPSDAIKPYHICDGPQLDVQLHADFQTNLGYETLGVLSPSYTSCCSSELGHAHSCVAAGAGSPTKYCFPVAEETISSDSGSETTTKTTTTEPSGARFAQNYDLVKADHQCNAGSFDFLQHAMPSFVGIDDCYYAMETLYNDRTVSSQRTEYISVGKGANEGRCQAIFTSAGPDEIDPSAACPEGYAAGEFDYYRIRSHNLNMAGTAPLSVSTTFGGKYAFRGCRSLATGEEGWTGSGGSIVTNGLEGVEECAGICGYFDPRSVQQPKPYDYFSLQCTAIGEGSHAFCKCWNQDDEDAPLEHTQVENAMCVGAEDGCPVVSGDIGTYSLGEGAHFALYSVAPNPQW